MTSTLPLTVEIRRHSAVEPWTYEMLDRRQREIAQRVRSGGQGALLLSEVAPVITVGRRTPDSDLQLSPDQLQNLGMDLHRTDRGGMATWHGPGQWVLFVVDELERLTGDPRGVRKAVQALLQVAYESALELGLTPEQHGLRLGEGCEMGVWTHTGKFAAVGVHIDQGVLLHGLAINLYPSPTSFQGLRPCGLDAPVSYLVPTGLESAQFEEFGHKLVRWVEKHFASP